MKKKLAFLLAIMMMVLALSACGSTKGAPLSKIQKNGKLTIATSPDFPPFESLNGDGKVEGIEIELLELICQELGVELDIQQMDFDSVLPGVQAGKFDMGVSGISITEKRQKNVLFTDPYCLAAQAIVVMEGSPISSKADLQGKSVSVQTGTTAETFCNDNGYQVSSFQANNDAQSALVQGKVDAWVIDDLTAADMVKAYNAENDSKLVVLEEPMTTEPYALAMAFGSEDTIAEVNKILEKLLSDGTVAEIFQKYDAPFTSPVA